MHQARWFILCVILISMPGVKAQEGYRSGYIIKNHGDTLTGLVYYGPDHQFYKRCRFKRFDLIDAVTYKPDEIKEFGFRNGRQFESKQINRKVLFYERPVAANHRSPSIRWFADRSIHSGNSRIRSGIQAGPEYVRPEITEHVARYFKEANLTSLVRLKTGFFVEYDLLRFHDRLFLGSGVFFLSDNYYGYAEYITASQCRDDIFMGYKALQFPVYLKFNLTGEKIRPFVKSGVFGSILVDRYYEHFAERQFGHEIFTEWYTDYELKNDLGYLISIGFDLRVGHARIISLEAQYMQGNERMTYTGGNYGVPLDNRIRTHVLGLLLSVNF